RRDPGVDGVVLGADEVGSAVAGDETGQDELTLEQAETLVDDDLGLEECVRHVGDLLWSVFEPRSAAWRAGREGLVRTLEAPSRRASPGRWSRVPASGRLRPAGAGSASLPAAVRRRRPPG